MPRHAGNLLIFINPNSGTGQSVQVFDKQIGPELRKRNIVYELITTGDGLIFEVLNGMLERPDKARLLRIPFGIVPTGTGNGLLASIFNYRQLPMKDGPFHETAYTVISDLKALAYSINLIHVETPTQQLGSFLSIGWGMMADVDIESENWRFMGSLRLFFGAVVRLINLRTYRGRLSYLKSESTKRKSINSTKVYSSTTPKNSRIQNATDENLYEFFQSRYGSEYERMDIPRLDEPIPDNWTVIDDEFVLVYAMSLSHISNNGHYVPQANLVDDQIYLTYILKNDALSRIEMTKFLLAVEGYFGMSGHQQFDIFNMVAVKSFRLEPIDSGSVITVDGEVIDCPKIQATVTDLNISVMSK